MGSAWHLIKQTRHKNITTRNPAYFQSYIVNNIKLTLCDLWNTLRQVTSKGTESVVFLRTSLVENLTIFWIYTLAQMAYLEIGSSLSFSKQSVRKKDLLGSA